MMFATDSSFMNPSGSGSPGFGACDGGLQYGARPIDAPSVEFRPEVLVHAGPARQQFG